MNTEHFCDYVSVNTEVLNPYTGPQGFSPKINIESTASGHLVTITDADGEKSFEIFDGKDGRDGIDGKNGADGKDGKDGKDGADGVSPTLPEISHASSLSYTITDDDCLATTGSLRFMMNRDNCAAAANTSYTTLMARGESLNAAETTPAVNGAIAWTYE